MPAIASEILRAAAPPGAAAGSPRRWWRPRPTVRLRLTLLYGTLFLLTGALLLTVTYELVAHTKTATSVVLPAPPGGLGGTRITNGAFQIVRPSAKALAPVGQGHVVIAPGGANTLLGKLRTFSTNVQFQARHQIALQRSAQLGALVAKSGVALAIMAFLSIGLGWLMAGRALRPVTTMNARALGITERNLHQRLALEGPDDELKELAGTFDGVLDRLEGAFESQRRFVANASHELRTPITVERTLVEVALADPGASVQSLRRTCERVLAAGEQQERLIEALLTLARSQRGIERREPFDLAAIAAEMIDGRESSRPDLKIGATLEPAPADGDPALAERMIGNLIDNAVSHNLHGPGWVRVWSGTRDRRATLVVSNSGPEIPADATELLLEPFRRLNGARTDHGRGLGLGLSIVSAIAAAHGADLIATPRAEGGLEVEVSFPPPRVAALS